MTSYAVPGQPLSSARERGISFAAGPGTFERHGTIYSSTVGLVERHSGQIAVHSSNTGAAQAIPEPGAIVIGSLYSRERFGLEAHEDVRDRDENQQPGSYIEPVDRR